MGKSNPETPRLAEQAYKMQRLQEMSVSEIAEYFGRTIPQVKYLLRYYRKYMRDGRSLVPEEGDTTAETVTFEDLKRASRSAGSSLMEAVGQLQNSLDDMDSKQVEVTLRLDNEQDWFGVAFTGDWHVGHRGTDHRRLEQDNLLIANTPGLYAVVTGDVAERAIIHRGSGFPEVISPEAQDMVVVRQADILDGSVLAWVRGCHDAWASQIADIDIVTHLAAETHAANLWHGGLITIKAGDEKYLIRARHKYRYNSSLNQANSARRMVEVLGECDTAALGHFHNPFVHQEVLQGNTVTLLRTGTYKVNYDDFAQRAVGLMGAYGVPVVLYNVNEHYSFPVPTLELGIQMLNKLRKGIEQ